MKLLDYWKIFKFTKRSGKDSSTAKLSHNELILNDIMIINHKLHSETYKLLRKFKAPQYNTIYSMRRKKGFNTLYFIMNYDVIVTDRHGLVLKNLEDVKPGYISDHYENGYSIYFMTVGTIKHFDIKEKDMLKVHRLSEWY